jgi:hypothetical protein
VKKQLDLNPALSTALNQLNRYMVDKFGSDLTDPTSLTKFTEFLAKVENEPQLDTPRLLHCMDAKLDRLMGKFDQLNLKAPIESSLAHGLGLEDQPMSSSAKDTKVVKEGFILIYTHK